MVLLWDIDPTCEDRAIIAAHKDSGKSINMTLFLEICKSDLWGVIEPEARKWFDIGSDMVDMIGGFSAMKNEGYTTLDKVVGA